MLENKRLIVIAEQEELKLVDEFKKIHHIENIPVLITGVGALNVINALKDIPRDTEILNIGYAGSKNLEPGKFYAVSSVTLYHPNVEYDEPIYTLSVTYISDMKMCYTSSDFVLQTELDNCLFDMELGYIAALGFKSVKAYKYVSDNLNLYEYRETLNEKE